jgi:hypothetical protein
MISDCWDKDHKKRWNCCEIFNILDHYYGILSDINLDLFLSHPWNSKCCLREVHRSLANSNYTVWFDENHMGHDRDESMKKGIDAAKVVLVFADAPQDNMPPGHCYDQRQNCMFELEYAKLQNKTIITVLIGSVNNSYPPRQIVNANSYNLHRYSDKFQECVGGLKKIHVKFNEEYDSGDWTVAKEDFTEVMFETLDKQMGEVIKLLKSVNCNPRPFV